MIDAYLREIRAAAGEGELVRIANAALERTQATSAIPSDCFPEKVGDGRELRAALSKLTHRQCADRVPAAAMDGYQKLLIVLGMAADRLALLESRGFAAAFGPPPAARDGLQPS